MMPSGRLNERNMRMAMRRMGMTTENLEDVTEVIIRRRSEEIVVEQPEVTVLTVQGMKTYQIAGNSRTRPLGSGPTPAASTNSAPAGPPEEDVELVMGQAGVDRAAAIRALNEANGEPAEAILKLLSKRKG